MGEIEKFRKFNFKRKIEILKKLKKERDAVILAHYYVDEEIQAVADYIGDFFFLVSKGYRTQGRNHSHGRSLLYGRKC
ncbi:quinolinate synthase NadA [Peptoniphilus timonensis]|uniref:quinolinate synthase NadA n=1 Tax=Peptoniphilus timonensis TaxID=1268254 RepID=UPI00315D9B16